MTPGLWFQDRQAWRLILLGYLPWFAGLNLAWEVAHVRLYTLWYEAPSAYIAFSVVHCTLGDVLIGAAALFTALIGSRQGSLARWRWRRVAVLAVLIGLAYTMFSEWMNITWLRSWAYAESMPKLELAGFEFGLTPLAQWLIVPPVALYLGRTGLQDAVSTGSSAAALINRLALGYYARMAGLGVVALALAGLQHIVAADPNHMASLGPTIALGIGAANAVAAWLLFRPIRRGLAGRGSEAVALARIARLPRLSAAWTLLLATALMMAPFVASRGFTLFYQALLMSTHALLMALFVYFLVDDYVARLKLEAYRLRGWESAVGRGSVVTKLVAAYLATAAVPFGLVFLDVYFADQVEALQMLNLRQAFLLDMIGAVAMTGAAIVFIRRGLLRPLDRLLASVERVDAGDLRAHAPVVSDDELGVLTDRFNRMVGQLREKAFLRETFGRYVPQRVAETILANRGAIEPQQRVATILFTDIQDFTRIAEAVQADRLVALLNDYFSQLVEIVERYGGVVTQLQGDALLVAFNVPLDDPQHAANAVRAALEIERGINHRAFGDGIRFITRVGINTGRVIAGPVGAEHRLIYTVHGDAVNLAARLEALNKEHGTRILISESTRQLAGGGFAFTALGEAMVRGKSEPIRVYTVTAAPERA